MHKKALFTWFYLGFFLNSAFAFIDDIETKEHKHEMPFRAGRVLVKTLGHNEKGLIKTANELGLSLLESYSIVPGLKLFEYDINMDVHDVINAFSLSESVEYAEPDYYYHAAVPNDPRYHEQYALKNTGQTGGSANADINAEAMWAIEDGSSSYVIGVIDTGVDYNHNDLKANMWHNKLEIPNNGIDDDNNGYIDDVYGINSIANNGDPMDDHFHGTHVAGTIGADGNNGIGIVGVAQDVKMAACKFLDANGSGTIADAIECMQYFAHLKTREQNPVNLIATSNSWGGGSYSSAMYDAIKVHRDLGILFVAAAGNSSLNNDLNDTFPANYDLNNVISVAATDHNDRIASFSNFGQRTVHVAAPGVQILSTYPNQSYALLSGTSMATPHVSGLIAVIKSHYPNYDYKKIKSLVLAGGTPLAGLSIKTISGRRIRGADSQGLGSLTCLNQQVSKRLYPKNSNITLTLSETVFLSAYSVNCDASQGSLTIYSDAEETVILNDDGSRGDMIGNDGILSLNWKPTRSGNYILNFGNGDLVTITVQASDTPSYVASNISYQYERIFGVALNAKDESLHAVTIPFNIHFNNDPLGFNKLYISTNGTISFDAETKTGYINRPLPTSLTSTLVAPYWDDFIPSGPDSDVFVAITGTAPHRHVVIEWRNLKHYNTSGNGSFQAVFYEDSSDIRFNYLDTNLGSINYNYGASATVGLQTNNSKAAQYSYNRGKISSRSSLFFRLQ